MLHAFLAKGDWFAPKRYGYGAGLPIAWQGWALLGSYGLVVTGLAALAGSLQAAPRAAAFVLILIATGLLIEISRRRTRGGWRWRWGNSD